jgi:hypothetical protein
MGRYRVDTLATNKEHVQVTRPDTSGPRGATLAKADAVEAMVPGVGAVTVSVDGAPGSSMTPVAVKGTEYGKLTIAPAGGRWAAGRHVVTIAVTRPGGSVIAAAVLFDVA